MELQNACRKALRNDVFSEWAHQHGDSSAAATQAQLRDPATKSLLQCLQQIADELDGNADLQRMINDSARFPSKKAVIKVASEIFSDGKFSWGRNVAFLYFVCRLGINAVVCENVNNWIREQGGWEDICFHFSRSTLRTIGVFLTGILATSLVTYKNDMGSGGPPKNV